MALEKGCGVIEQHQLTDPQASAFRDTGNQVFLLVLSYNNALRVALLLQSCYYAGTGSRLALLPEPVMTFDPENTRPCDC